MERIKFTFRLALTTALGAWLLTPSAFALDTEMLLDNGDPVNRVDIAILGDGYQDTEQAQLTLDATAVVERMFQQDTFGAYRNFYNVRLVHVISNESGADNGAAGGTRDTALDATFNCNGIDRLLCVDSGKAFAVAAADAPEYDQVLVVVNDSKYGGAGGSLATTSTNVQSADIAVHELGHSLFGLADEYDSATPGWSECDSVADCPEPNMTVFTSLSDIKWAAWIETGTPLPTPENDPSYVNTIGAFEGGRYFADDQYRPKDNCLMKVLSSDFCSVCGEAGVLSAYGFVDLVDEAIPATNAELSGSDPFTFMIASPEPEPNSLVYRWSIDGILFDETSTGELEVIAADFGVGMHVLSVEILDQTLQVRNDPTELLRGAHDWQVNVTNVVYGNFLGFEETPLGWTSNGPATISASNDANQGVQALRVNGCGYTSIASRTFASDEVGTVTNQVRFDVKLPTAQQNPWWLGQVQLFLRIPSIGLQNVQVGAVGLTGLQLGQWETIAFTMPSNIATALRRTYADARFTLTVNTNNCGRAVLIDAIRFDGSATPDDEPESDFDCTGACLSAIPIGKDVQSGSFQTQGEVWFVVDGPVMGWQASETMGRQIFVNGVLVTPGQMPLPAKAEGKYYFRFTAGSFPWTSWSFW